MIKGFLFGFGLLLGFAVFIIILILILKIKKKKKHDMPVKEWKKYLEQVLKAEDFAEAKFVTSLILNKDDDEEIKTPDGYKVIVKSDFEVHESDSENSSKIGFVKKYKVLKRQDDGTFR